MHFGINALWERKIQTHEIYIGAKKKNCLYEFKKAEEGIAFYYQNWAAVLLQENIMSIWTEVESENYMLRNHSIQSRSNVRLEIEYNWECKIG